MGRTAAYTKKRISWSDLLADTTQLEYDTKGLKA
jgi:hypothetical protein